MNVALTYLWFVLLKRKALRFLSSLRQPSTLIGAIALLFALSFCFYYRRDEAFSYLVRKEVLIGGAFVMLGGSLFKGFLQRGLVFELPDVQFLFTSPFTQRQLVFYRLLPGYAYAVTQSTVFLVLFWSHLKHPLLTSACLALFQIACFHLAAGAAIFAGTLSEPVHHRIRWAMLSVYLFITLLYCRVVLGLKIAPAFATSSAMSVFFYPAMTVSEVGATPGIGPLAIQLVNGGADPAIGQMLAPAYLGGFAAVAITSLLLLFRLKADILEPSLATTTRIAERRLRLRQGRTVAEAEGSPQTSAELPQWSIFKSVGAIVWKNLVTAQRSKRELYLAGAFVVIYTGLLVVLRWLMHRITVGGDALSDKEIGDFDGVIAGMLCVQVFLLQRALPFDFRRDGNHLVGFRTLPVTPFALVFAELAVPTIFCLALQGAALAALIAFAHFSWRLALPMLLAFPAIVFALNGVWNLHYLLSATRRIGSKAESASPVTLLMVVVLSFLIFYPAGWTALWVGRHTVGPLSITLAAGAALAVQYLVDLLLVAALAQIYQRYEVSRA